MPRCKSNMVEQGLAVRDVIDEIVEDGCVILVPRYAINEGVGNIGRGAHGLPTIRPATLWVKNGCSK